VSECSASQRQNQKDPKDACVVISRNIHGLKCFINKPDAVGMFEIENSKL